MDAALCIVLLFAASVTGRPLGLEIAKVCIFAKKKFFYFGRKKKTGNVSCQNGLNVASSQTNLCPKQVGQQTENEKRINYFQEGLKARGLSSRLAPKYCTLDNSADFFRYLGYKVSGRMTLTSRQTDKMTD